MQQNFSDFNIEGLGVLFSKSTSLEEMKALPAKRPFDESVCDFLNEVSSLIMKDMESRQFPDVITFGFFCRKGNIEKLKQEYYSNNSATTNRLGRGLSFHIAPSNVPINLAYTLVAGLLAGNSCVVRSSTRDFEQTKILCRLFEAAFEKTNSNAAKYIAVLRYEHSKEITDKISALSDVRVIWGGDNTVSEIRKSPIPARCVEICFADRYSMCVVNATSILALSGAELKTLAQDFYNDTYLYDQNACSSPRLMYWLGNAESAKKAREIFWKAVHENISGKYNVEPIIAVDKLVAGYKASLDFENVELENSGDNLINRIKVKTLDKALLSCTCAGGSFVEYQSETLDELFPFITKKFQTLSYFGVDPKELADGVLKAGVAGVDRIVPIGKTSDFSLIWDGFNLIDEMSRIVYY